MSQNQPNSTSKKNLLKPKAIIEGIAGLGKIPPQAVDLEEVILGAMMLEKEGLVLGMAEIQFEEIFYKEGHQKIFLAMKNIFSSSNPVDILTVTNELRKAGTLEIAGGAYAISELTTKVNSAANISYHISIIKEKWIARLIIKVCNTNLQMAYDDTNDIFQLLEKSSMEYLKLNRQLSTKKAATGKLVYLSSMEKLATAMLTPGITGLSTGLPELDKITGGWQSPDLIIIAGRPGMGKTAFVISTTKHVFLGEKKPVLIFSLEMTANQLMDRLISGESEYSAARLKKGHISQQEFIEIQTKTQHLFTDTIIIDDTPAITIGQLRAKSVAEKLKNPELQLIVVDYLQLMKSSNPKQNNREQEIAEISSGLKALAKELDIPVIALAQLSRGVETRGGSKKPQLSDLRESGAIENDADVVIFLFRPEYYDITEYEDGSSTKGRADIIYGKNRHGPCTEVTIGFNGPLVKFHSLEVPDNFKRIAETIVPKESKDLFYNFENPDKEFEDEDKPF